jgi:hypothetical protein
VSWDFPKVGRKEMVLNGRRVANDSGTPEMILLAIDLVR